MSIKQRRHVLKVIVPLFVLALSAGAMSACGDNNSDTTSTEPTVEEASTTTAVEEPAALTAETTGNVTATEPTVEGEPTGEIFFEVEVTMDDGSVRYFPIDRETLVLIWPEEAGRLVAIGEVTATDGVGVRVVIEEVDGEQRITGPAE